MTIFVTIGAMPGHQIMQPNYPHAMRMRKHFEGMGWTYKGRVTTPELFTKGKWKLKFTKP